MENNKKIVLVSGASSGIGRAIAEYLAEKGCIVYAGARSYKDYNEATKMSPTSIGGGSRIGFQTESISPTSLKRPGWFFEKNAKNRSIESCYKDTYSENLHKVYLDVTDQSTIQTLVDDIINQEGRLDVLVNCAAVYTIGSVEDMNLDEYKKVIDTNLYGTLSMCKAVIPQMRRKNYGYIINLSSVAGVVAIPFHSAYVATKFAIEGLTESLSMELKDYGINLVIIEPGDHRNGSQKCRSVSKNAALETSPYYEKFTKVAHKLEWEERNGSDPVHVGKLVFKIINTPKPKLRYTIGKFEQKLSLFVKKILPGRIFEKIVNDYYTRHTIN